MMRLGLLFGVLLLASCKETPEIVNGEARVPVEASTDKGFVLALAGETKRFLAGLDKPINAPLRLIYTDKGDLLWLSFPADKLNNADFAALDDAGTIALATAGGPLGVEGAGRAQRFCNAADRGNWFEGFCRHF